MDLDLLTIARRGSLGTRISNKFQITIKRLNDFEVLLNKISSSTDFSELEKEQHRVFTIIGVVSVFENYVNDVLFDVLVSFPKKFGNKKFEIDELREERSLLALFEKKANQTILDLAYGRFEKYFERFSSIIGIKDKIDSDKLNLITEIKTTRDVYIHNDGKANSLYFQKVGVCARVNNENDILPIDLQYVNASISLIIEVLTEIFNKIPLEYRNSSQRRVFKTMWELTCLNKRVPFETAWEVIDEENFYIKNLETNYGFSHSETLIYNMFKDIYSGTHTTDFGDLMKRWSPDSNESQIAFSWLNSPFWF